MVRSMCGAATKAEGSRVDAAFMPPLKSAIMVESAPDATNAEAAGLVTALSVRENDSACCTVIAPIAETRISSAAVANFNSNFRTALPSGLNRPPGLPGSMIAEPTWEAAQRLRERSGIWAAQAGRQEAMTRHSGRVGLDLGVESFGAARNPPCEDQLPS